MTKSEFEQRFAERSKTTVEGLNSRGYYAVPCDCDADCCRGWAMTHIDLMTESELKELQEPGESLGLDPQ